LYIGVLSAMVHKLLLGFFLLIGLASCRPKQKSFHTGEKLHVLATTGIIADMLREVGGTFIEVDQLMGAGVDPHLYKVSQNDLVKFREADIIFYNGLHLEGKMSETLEKVAKKRQVLALSDVLPEIKLHRSANFGGAHDPHIWFDVSVWSMTVDGVVKAMSATDTVHAKYFIQNGKNYQGKLAALDERVKKQIATIPRKQRVLITAHDAFGYFGSRYDIEVKGLQGISTLTDFGLADVRSLVDFIVARNIPAIFIETSVSSRSIEAVLTGCKSRGSKVIKGGSLYSDALGKDGTPDGTYIGMVTANVNTIVHALNKPTLNP
jgi:manganese/zinc/iron transport system substrate-binding protein